MTDKEKTAIQNWLSAVFLEVPTPQEMILPPTGERVRMVIIRQHLFNAFLCRIGVPVIDTIEECRRLKWVEDMKATDADGKETRALGIRANVVMAASKNVQLDGAKLEVVEILKSAKGKKLNASQIRRKMKQTMTVDSLRNHVMKDLKELNLIQSHGRNGYSYIGKQ